jgi:hypothetical protein
LAILAAAILMPGWLLHTMSGSSGSTLSTSAAEVLSLAKPPPAVALASRMTGGGGEASGSGGVSVMIVKTRLEIKMYFKFHDYVGCFHMRYLRPFSRPRLCLGANLQCDAIAETVL